MPTFSQEELDEIYAFAVNLGKEAGRMLLDAAKLRFGTDRPEEQAHVEKDNAVDLVTQTDEGKDTQIGSR
jgi:myo-inositol-1(or 4)-monophosphatase